MTQPAKVGQSFPQGLVKIVDDQTIESGRWQLLVVYRGLHCPMCKNYLGQIEAMKKDFDQISVDVLAISTDPEDKARKFRDDNQLSFPVGYGLSIRDARALGLFISDPRSSAETDQPFAEPGLYVIRPDGVLQVMDVSNAPFSRPDLKMLKSGIEFVQGNDYPVRGQA